MIDGIKVTGLNQTVRALKDIGTPVKELNQAAKDAGEVVAVEARALAPVKTGRLRNSIRVASLQNRVVVRAGNNTAVPYAGPIHFGWFRRGIMPNPFFYKALNMPTVAKEVIDRYMGSLNTLASKYKATK